MADINVEMLKEKLYKVQKALFCMGEVCVDVSKQHISETDALKKIRGYLNDAKMYSRFEVDRLIAECMEQQVDNIFGSQHEEWLKRDWNKWIGLEPQINYPDCCDGCSNNPKNGGSGICNCTLPYMQNPINYTVSFEDTYATNNTNGYPYIFGKEKQHPDDYGVASAERIVEAVQRTKKYIKE